MREGIDVGADLPGIDQPLQRGIAVHRTLQYPVIPVAGDLVMRHLRYPLRAHLEGSVRVVVSSLSQKEIISMSEQNMKIVRRLLEEVWTQGNLSLLPEIVAEDVVSYPMPQSGAVRGREEYKNFIAVYKGVFLDMNFRIED